MSPKGLTAAETSDLVETAFSGPGRLEAISLCVDSYDAVATEGLDRVAFCPIPSSNRIRVYAGNFNLVSPWNDRLVFTVPRGHATTELLFDLEGEEGPGPQLFPELAVINAPRAAVAPHTGLLLTGLVSAGRALASASRCPRTHSTELERVLRAIAA